MPCLTVQYTVFCDLKDITELAFSSSPFLPPYSFSPPSSFLWGEGAGRGSCTVNPMGHDDWAILKHFKILLLLVCEAKKQHYFLSKECGLGSPTCPKQGVSGIFREHLDSPKRGKMFLENSFKSLKLPVRLI